MDKNANFTENFTYKRYEHNNATELSTSETIPEERFGMICIIKCAKEKQEANTIVSVYLL